MDGTGPEMLIPQPPDREPPPDALPGNDGGGGSGVPEENTLSELVRQLEQHPAECLHAFHGLESIDSQTRLSIIEGLAPSARRAGVATLLHLLASSGNEATRNAALIALGGDPNRPRLVHCLVTAVDGAGQASIAISASLNATRRTAVFLCDVEKGITGSIGQLEEESPGAGLLLREVQARSGGPVVVDSPDLALGLLAGSFMLGAASTLPVVAEWLERTLGPGFHPRELPLAGDWSARPVGSGELQARAGEVLDACPGWLDASALTFELAEEIFLREGRVTPDPERDSGAFRFLFEHRIVHRLERYRRMLLWMAWFWGAGGEQDLARSAQILSWQLSDEQYAVPAHPFALALTARSLDAAQAQREAFADVRAVRKHTP
jgi:hypothetical protein